MKKVVLTLALVCAATMGFAQSDNDQEAKNTFIQSTANGTVYDFNAAAAKIQELNQSIENHKAGIEKDKAEIVAINEQMKQAKETLKNATKVIIAQ